jgi:4-diphosphocytidyl-2-C-methyl-D-erythritol kinase
VKALLTLQAYAKINIGLRICSKRADGYHDIETVFHRVQPHDELIFEPSSVISLVSNKHDLPTDEGNLCIRAASLLQQRYAVKDGVHLSLKKFIPVAAGLGGGSSDAAATILGLAEFWGLAVPAEERQTLGLKLGSDVPYFLTPGTAHATGRGERLNYFPLSLPYWIVLVYPNIHVSTAWAYREARIPAEQSDLAAPTLDELLKEHLGAPDRLRRLIRNDFEQVVFQAYPVVGEIKQRLYDEGAVFAQMSGSGSAVFGFFPEEQSARAAVVRFGKSYQSFLTPPGFSPG